MCFRLYSLELESVNKNEWAPAEDRVLTEQQLTLGNKWSEIAKVSFARDEPVYQPT